MTQKCFVIVVSMLTCVFCASLLTYGYETVDGSKEIEDEIRALERIVVSHPNTSKAVHALCKIAFLYEKQKKHDKAIECYGRAISNSNRHKDFVAIMKWDISRNYLAKKEYSKAIEVLQEIIEKYPESRRVAHAKYSIAHTYYKMKDYPKAIEQYQRIAEDYPDDWQGRLALAKIGEVYTTAKDYEKAVASYEKIIKKYPETNDAKAARGYIRLIKEYYEKGIKPTGKEVDEIFIKEGLEKKGYSVN